MLLTVLFVKFANFPTFILARASAIKFLVFANLNPNLEEIIHNVAKTFMKLLQSKFLCTSTISLGFTREEGGANSLTMYCNQSFFGGKYDLIQVYRQIIHKNDVISKRNWLKSSLPAFFTLWTTKNDMAARAFWACFCSSRQPSEIGPTAENAALAIPSSFLGFTIEDMSLKWVIIRLVIILLTFSKHCILSTVGVKFYGQPIVIFTDNILLP